MKQRQGETGKERRERCVVGECVEDSRAVIWLNWLAHAAAPTPTRQLNPKFQTQTRARRLRTTPSKRPYSVLPHHNKSNHSRSCRKPSAPWLKLCLKNKCRCKLWLLCDCSCQPQVFHTFQWSKDMWLRNHWIKSCVSNPSCFHQELLEYDKK